MSSTIIDGRDDAATMAAKHSQSVGDEFSAFITDAGGVDAEWGSALNACQVAIEEATFAARSGVQEADAILADDTIYPDGRSRLAKDRREQAERDAGKAFERAEAAQSVLEAQLTVAALPPEPKGQDALVARQDALMVLDRAKDKALALQRLAARQDGVGALATGRWVEDYLAATGVPAEAIKSMVAAAQMVAVQAAAEGTDARRARAARARLGMSHIGKARAYAVASVNMALRP